MLLSPAMKRRSLQLPVLAALTAIAAHADPLLLGTNVTISDNNYSTGWYGNREDNETETNPETLVGQQWDLEGMYLHGTTLSLVGGYDFKNGASAYGHTYLSGDIFVDVNGDALYGTAAANTGATEYGIPQPLLTTNLLGYDYALQLNFEAMTYNVLTLTPGTSVVSRVTDVAAANPYRYVSGGTPVAGAQNLTLSYFGPLSPANAGDPSLLGYGGNNQHYVLQVDTSFLPSGITATFHYTMECGNDDLMGRFATPVAAVANPVPDSATSTLLLLVGATLALFGLRRRFV